MKIDYPVRCQIIDITGQEVLSGIKGRTPDESKPHIGKKGLAERIGRDVRITLDDGSILWGYECWWTPLKADNKSLDHDADKRRRLALR